MTADSPPTPINTPAGAKPIYRCGTLRYTQAGLFVLFGWLLWGDFCFTVFETVGGPGILALYLQDNFHISNFQVNLVFGVIPQIIAIAVGPPLSFKSDRHRGRWGRRIPFMLFTMPFLCLFAVAIGFTDEIIAFMETWIGPSGLISPLTAGLLVVGLMVVGFTFFNEFVQNVYWYLFADVVPEEFMGRFIGLFRTVGSIASFLLNIWIMPHQLTHMLWIHVGVAVLYFVGFGAMCLGVKEGKYPPPTDVSEKTTFWESARLYFRECFTHRIFIMIYLTTFFTALSGIVGVAGVFGLHVDQHQATVPAHGPGPAALALSADGALAVSGGADRRVKLWDCAGPKEFAPLRALGEHAAAITCVALSADGARAASGSEDGEIRIWTVATGERLLSLPGEAGNARCLALFRDGGTLLAGGADGKVRVWNLKTGELATTLEGHTNAVNSLAVSSDEQTVASGSSDRSIRLWNARDWSAGLVLPDTGAAVYALCFAPSLEAGNGKPKNTLPVIGFIITYFRDVFSNESFYDIPAGRRSRILEADRWLVSGGRDGKTDDENSMVRLWDAKDGTLIRSLKGHKAAVTALQFKADLRLIVSGSRDKSMRLWDPADISSLAGDQSLRSFSGYTFAVTALACKPEGSGLVNASDNGDLHRWDMDQGVSLRKMGLKASFFSLLAILLAFPTGMLVDKFRPLRVTLFATLLIGPVQIAYYFFVHTYLSMVWLDCVKVPLYCLLSAAAMPLTMQLFPKSKYGQFCAAASTIRSLVLAAGGTLGAIVVDWLTQGSMLTDNYRYGYLWLGISYLFIFLAWILVYREWKKLGGDTRYVAPES